MELGEINAIPTPGQNLAVRGKHNTGYAADRAVGSVRARNPQRRRESRRSGMDREIDLGVKDPSGTLRKISGDSD